MCKKFIDISEHNTILSYNAIANANLSGVIMKATEGVTYKDGLFDISYEQLNGKIALGFYHFLRETSEPEEQAQAFWDKIKDKDYQIIPILDVEADGLKNECIAQEYSERFMQEFYTLSGQNMIMYSYISYIEDNFSTTFRANNTWWVADYEVNECPTISGCDIIAWQYTEDDRSYAFTMGDLDVSILEDESKFFIGSNSTYVPKTPSESATIMVLQNELNVQGFKDKNGNSIVVDGVAGELTLSACPLLKTGCKGNITMWVQSQLKIPFDGIFGEQTRQAVITYQENMSLTGDGIVGQDTWRKLLGM